MLNGENSGVGLPEGAPLKRSKRKPLRRPAALALLAFLLALPQPGGQPTPSAMLAAARKGGFTPDGFIVSATRMLAGGEDAAAILRGAAIALQGKALTDAALSVAPHLETLGGAPYLTATMTAPPSAWAAAEAAGRLRSAFGAQAQVTVCLTGHAGQDAEAAAAAALAALGDSAAETARMETASCMTGDFAQAAWRADGTILLGVPLIPVSY